MSNHRALRFANSQTPQSPEVFPMDDFPYPDENAVARAFQESESLKQNLQIRSYVWGAVKERFNAATQPHDYERELLKQEQDKFTRTLLGSFEQEPLEDGYRHPAEDLMKDALIRHKSTAEDWIQDVFLNNIKNRPTVSAGILRCIGRLNRELTRTLGLVMVFAGLLFPDIELREAAILTLETWGDNESLKTLQGYVELEKEPWLKKYIKQVITDLSETG